MKTKSFDFSEDFTNIVIPVFDGLLEGFGSSLMFSELEACYSSADTEF